MKTPEGPTMIDCFRCHAELEDTLPGSTANALCSECRALVAREADAYSSREQKRFRSKRLRQNIRAVVIGVSVGLVIGTALHLIGWLP